jgi:hypothetical protein
MPPSSDPLVSILIPVANGAEYLWESLTSVLQQTYTHWECWIALNGAGLKGPAAAVAAACVADHPQIHILSQPPTICTKVASLNHALRYCRGDWVALLDVDDRWAPTKLAEQIAVARDTSALLIGTWTRYFGEFSGVPSLPAGFLDPAQLCDVNPIVNSSVLFRIWRQPEMYDGCVSDQIPHEIEISFAYHSTVPAAIEDYFCWMKFALQHRARDAAAASRVLYNIPRILVDHRIHKASTFNSQGHSPAPLQAWYRAQLLQQQQQRPPLRILTVWRSGAPFLLRAQITALRQHLGTPWECTVLKDAAEAAEAEEECRKLGVRCISVPQGYSSNTMLEIVQQTPGRYWMLSSDMWPVAFLGPADVDRFFQEQEQEQEQEQNAGQCLASQVWWMDTTRAESHKPCWGSGLQLHSSGQWTLKDLPQHLQANTALVEFLTQDPRNSGPALCAELYAGVLLRVCAEKEHPWLNRFLQKGAYPGV